MCYAVEYNGVSEMKIIDDFYKQINRILQSAPKHILLLSVKKRGFWQDVIESKVWIEDYKNLSPIEFKRKYTHDYMLSKIGQTYAKSMWSFLSSKHTGQLIEGCTTAKQLIFRLVYNRKPSLKEDKRGDTTNLYSGLWWGFEQEGLERLKQI